MEARHNAQARTVSTRSTLTVAPATRSLWRGLPAPRGLYRNHPIAAKRSAAGLGGSRRHGYGLTARADKARRHGSCRRRLYRSVTTAATTAAGAATAGSAPGLRNTSRRLNLWRRGRRLLRRRWSRWRRCHDRRGWNQGLRRRRRYRNRRRIRYQGIPRANRSEHRGKHRTRRFPPSRRHDGHVRHDARRSLPELTALRVDAATRCVGSFDPGSKLAMANAILL